MSQLLKNHSLLDLYKRNMAKLPVDISQQLDAIEQTIQSQIPRWKNKQLHTNILERVQELAAAQDNLNSAISDLENRIQDLLLVKEKSIIQRDYTRVEKQVVEDEDFLIRNSWLTEEIKDKLVGFIHNHNAIWQHGSLEINPGDGYFSDLMNAADPQYCIVANRQVEQAIKGKFNEFYSNRRLRCYTDIAQIPDNGIGFATCINLYEYLPVDNIKYISSHTFDKLKPGGKFLITYNDCEQRYSLEMLDHEARCLATKTLIQGLHYGMGYDVLDSGSTNDGVWSYMLLQKPGTLTSQKMAAPIIEFVESKG